MNPNFQLTQSRSVKLNLKKNDKKKTQINPI